MTHRYTAAADGWLAFITPARQLFVGTDLDAAGAERLWVRLRDERGPAGILETLTADGLVSTPPFAFLEAGDGSVNAIVRGDATVSAAGERVSGAGATTWIERRLAGVDLEVELPGAAGPRWPIESGVVRASAFTTSATPVPDVGPQKTVPAPVAAPAPVAQSESEPAPEDAARVSEETVVSLDEAASALPPSPPAPIAPPGPAGDAEDGYDYLFGATMYRSVQDAAVPADDGSDEAEQDAPPADQPEADGDHDGSTVMMTSIARARGRRPKGSAPAPPAAPSLAVVLPDGTREVLDPVVVIGRAPSVSGVPAGQLPRLVAISGGDKDISRSHVRIALEGGVAVVTDLHSRNGTSLVLPNGETQKLRGGEPTPVIVGTVVDLGGGVVLSLEEL